MENLTRLSFRDPAGAAFTDSKHVFRTIRPEHVAFFLKTRETSLLQGWIEEGKLVDAEVIDSGMVSSLSLPEGSILVLHPKIEFPSYPNEWCAGMLHAAGALTVEISRKLISERMRLKDANVFNILFQGPRPVFVDWLSFEPLPEGDYTWLAYSQFMRHFVNPLLLKRATKISTQDLFFRRRDGVSEGDVYEMLTTLQRITPSYLFGVSLPHWLGKKASRQSIERAYQPKKISREKADFFLHQTYARLNRALDRAAPADSASRWVDYDEGRKGSYSSTELQLKEAFVSQYLQAEQPKKVLDVGCNTGHFSRMAAKSGSEVVSIDSDENCVQTTWRQALALDLNILPLVVDLARPTPAMGWKNLEEQSFLSRANHYFDGVFALAVIHHLVVTSGISLDEVRDLFAEITTKDLILEYVSPEDPMFRIISRGRDFNFFTLDYFKSTMSKRFSIETEKTLSDTRTIFHFRKN